MTTSIPIIELTGNPKEMGLQFGTEFKLEIREFAETRVDRTIKFCKRYGKIDLSRQEVLDIAESLLPAHQDYCQELWQEFEGIAAGAGISLPLLLVANGYTDIRDYICKVKGFNDLEVRFEGCTAFMVDKTMTTNNQVIVGQTWDMSVEAINYLILVKKQYESGLKTLYLTTMGALGLIGLNSKNMAVGTTNLMANDSIKGVNYLFNISKALKQDNYSELHRTITNTNRMSGHSFFCTDSTQGNVIEASAKNYLDYKLDHYPLVKTNNYSDAFRQYEIFIPEQRRRNSIFRYSRMLGHLCQKSVYSPDDLWALLADDHRNDGGAAICNEDYSCQFGEFATAATILLMPKQKKIWVCRGGAKSGEKQEVSLD